MAAATPEDRFPSSTSRTRITDPTSPTPLVVQELGEKLGTPATDDSKLCMEAATGETSPSSTSLPDKNIVEGENYRDRDEALAKVNQERTLSHIRAWEENEKAKAANKYNKTIAKIDSWEIAQKAAAEANLKKAEETLERRKAAYVEKMRNQISEVHKSAEEQRAVAEARKGEEMVKAEELAARFRAQNHVPRKFLCFGP
ncbi:hypothetical protein KP509_33G027200 [Ceratopteris richardii]|uniref:Remorin C-terminal domain-containing protein n=1 Tax=Ceratopteris richardii TaxID=49495 RepID=A0A8T2QPJ4_CERRI|nr:hypothetical protein KP509_33G027200 [Ceratopteris richardii]